ncbi:LacI family DNA-binding transcriptional regulator [Mucisphaera calidilacus]|uniref:Putative HTH-type transcriptional repressor ExuR n=1 Tax=Mucisphaera calidilacus TaxID=2527982 RepID=A0A518BYI7_9BACT|nr:LacI family DNA-binding transcriptional regulator [Mucisphaera calidilacus]QDU72035.1 putative HTH-type transcriptional repressor ExuR [Mucisphaera calidilacus]
MSLKAPPTLSDIALKCNLSKGSVSRALSMTADECPLNPRTRKRVIKVAREMGYRVNAHARALSKGRSQNIGLVYEGALPVLDSVYHDIIESLLLELRARDYHLSLIPIDEKRSWEDAILTGRIDACVCFQEYPEHVAETLQRRNMPIVLLNGISDKATGVICPNDRQGTELGVKHLVDLGHRDIAFVADIESATPHYSILERRNAFLDAMHELVGPADESTRIYNSTISLARALQTGHAPTAVLCYSHFEAIPVIRHIRRAGFDIPHDISLLAFNDVFPVDVLDPALSCIAVPAEAIGRSGARMILEQIEIVESGSASNLINTRLILDEELVLRESTAPVRAGATTNGVHGSSSRIAPF